MSKVEPVSVLYNYEPDILSYMASSINWKTVLENPNSPLQFDMTNVECIKEFVDASLPIKGTCVCELPISQVAFSPADYRTWRSEIRTTRRVLKVFKSFGTKWALVINTYLFLCPEDIRQTLMYILCANAASVGRQCEACFIERLKNISLVALRLNIERGPGWWSFLSDIHTIGGYDTILNRVDVLAEYASTSQRIRGIDNERIRHIIKETCSNFKMIKPNRQVTFRQFINFRDSWALPGACTHGEPLLFKKTNRRREKPTKVRGKFANLVSYTDEQIVRMCNDPVGATIFPFRKADEPVKTRVVQSYDALSYLRCSYASTFISSYNSGIPWTTMGMSQIERAQTRRILMQRLHQPGRLGISIDQSAFDESQLKSLVRYCIQSIWESVISKAREDVVLELTSLMQLDLLSFDEAKVYHKEKGGVKFVCNWQQGVPSGHKWTALIDSLINRAETIYALEQLNIPIDSGMWQGDDAAVIVNCSESTAKMLPAVFTSMGLSVNAAKTWISDKRFEFLHEVHGPEGAWGFPARIGRSMIWSKPILGSGGYTPPHLQANEMWDVYRKAIRRGLSATEPFLRSVLKWSGKPKNVCLEFLNTPLALGGGGLGFAGRTAASWTKPKVLYNKIRICTPIKMTIGESDIDKLAIFKAVVRRIGEAAPIPVKAATLNLFTVKGSSNMAEIKPAIQRVPKTDWVLYDCNKVDAWRYKLLLEYYLTTGNTIPQFLVASKAILESVMGWDAAIRLINRWSDYSICFANSYSSGESFAPIADWTNKVWAGILSHTAMYRLSGKRLGEEAARLAFAAFQLTQHSLAGMRVAV